MRHIIIIFVAAIMPLLAVAQSVEVVSLLQINENSQADVMYNNEFGHKINREVDDDFPYAVVRVDLEGDQADVVEAKQKLTLDLGYMFKVEEVNTGKDNRILFLVKRGVKSVYLLCGDGCERKELYSGAALQQKKEYICRVRYHRASGPAAPVLKSNQYLQISVQPANARVMIDNDYVEVEDGVASKYLPFGKHTYSVDADDYHSQSAEVEVNDPNNKVVVNVTLKPAFGYLTISANQDLDGASVYLDGKMVGRVPVTKQRVASGGHKLMLVKSMYKTFNQAITIDDERELQFKPQMEADFATVTLKASAGVEIWVNSERKGVGSWSGKLATGEYIFETRREGHRPMTVKRQITPSTSGVIEMSDPTPIYGSMNIAVKPSNAEVLLDGKSVGTTPLFLQQVLIGSHEIVIRKNGCAERRETVKVTEGETFSVEGRLAEGQDVRLSCGVPTAHWTVDGVERGTGSEITVNLSYSEHSVVIKAEGYRDFEERFMVETSSSSRAFTMKKPGLETITVNGVSFNMIMVEGGTFQMGSNDGDDDEKPVHSVTLSDYYIGEMEVTQALWEAVMGTTVTQQRDKVDKSWPLRGVGDNYPMYYINWNECQEFIQKLNKLTGRKFALPTEAQWEFAARGGNKSRGYKYSGSNNIGSVAWYIDNSSSETHPVGTKQANELGIYDMSGNVWEWCQDWRGTYNSYSETNPTGPSSGSCRVRRGGSCRNDAGGCRSANRDNFSPDFRYYDLGLRLVMLP